MRTRRRLLASLGAAGLAGLAGCGFGGDGDRPATSTPTATTEPTATATPTADPTTTRSPPTEEPTTGTTTGAGVVDDRVWRVHVPGETSDGGPAFNALPARGAGSEWRESEWMLRLPLYYRSLVDQTVLSPGAVRDWQFEDGVARFELYEDHYWVSDDPDEVAPVELTAADWQEATYELRQDRHVNIADSEQTGEYSFTVYQRTSVRPSVFSIRNLESEFLLNLAYVRPWLEQLRDAGTDSERREVRTELATTTEPTPHAWTLGPFRYDGETDAGWRLTLRDDEEPVPRWVDDFTFDTVEVVATDSPQRQTEAFTDGETPFAGSWSMGGDASYSLDPSTIDVDAPFETSVVQLPANYWRGAYAFHLEHPPTDDVHFRRAFAYLLNRADHATRFVDVDEVPTGIVSAADEERYLSADVLDQLRNGPHDNYGFDGVMTQAAAAELQAGGYERDSEGRWLYRQGDRAGEPMSFDVPAYPWLDRLVDRASGFADAMAEFGIDLSWHTAPPGDAFAEDDDGETLAVAFVTLAPGGGWSYQRDTTIGDLYEELFLDAGITWVDRTWDPTIDAVPVGEFGTPAGSATDATTTYRAGELIDTLDRLPPDQLSESLDRLAWLYNQYLPQIPVGSLPWTFTVNRGAWDWPLPVEDYPEAWTRLPQQGLWLQGDVEARSTGE